MTLAFGLGLVGSLPFFVTFEVWTYGLVVVAGLLVAWVAPTQSRRVIGLILGVAVPFAAWGSIEVVDKIRSCEPGGCVGVSSPNITIAIVIGFGLLGLASAGAGYLVGRFTGAMARRLRTARS